MRKRLLAILCVTARNKMHIFQTQLNTAIVIINIVSRVMLHVKFRLGHLNLTALLS